MSTAVGLSSSPYPATRLQCGIGDVDHPPSPSRATLAHRQRGLACSRPITTKSAPARWAGTREDDQVKVTTRERTFTLTCSSCKLTSPAHAANVTDDQGLDIESPPMVIPARHVCTRHQLSHRFLATWSGRGAAAACTWS
jgi:hypothetical protein